MNDRYLFRAKRIDNGKWVDGAFYIEPYTDFCYIIQWNSSGLGFNEFIKVDRETICQCTGKRDKHNNLIFENDLMDGFIYPYLSGLDSEHDYFAEVCWCDDITGFGICTHKYKNSDVRGSADGDVDLIEDFDSSKWEVIGNIFDNPELLESEE